MGKLDVLFWLCESSGDYMTRTIDHVDFFFFFPVAIRDLPNRMANYRLISKDVKERVLWLIDHQYAPDDICGISKRSIRHWKANYRIHGSVAPPPSPLQGRPRILNGDMTHDLNTLLLEVPELYLDEIQDWLAVAYQHCVSKSTLFRHIHDAGMTFKLLNRAAAERDDELRCAGAV